jgi:hypothetical protein
MGDEMVAEGMKKAYMIIDGPLHNQFTCITHIYVLREMIQHIAMHDNTLHAITRRLITRMYLYVMKYIQLYYMFITMITCHYIAAAGPGVSLIVVP